jgi:hypothetical protein
MGRASAGAAIPAEPVGVGTGEGDPAFAGADVQPAASTIPAKKIKIRMVFMIAPRFIFAELLILFFAMVKNVAEVQAGSPLFKDLQ